MARTRTINTECWLPLPLEQVFAFFADAGNLEALTPAWLKFQIVTPLPITMGRGALIEYRLKVRGLPLKWLTKITAWDPPHRFVDEQLHGPYRLWIHEHRFEEKAGGTTVLDRVDYQVPGGILEPLVHRWFVGPDLRKIFAFRQEQLPRLLGVNSGQRRLAIR